MSGSYECRNCGNIVSVRDDKCPYCGTFRTYTSQSNTSRSSTNIFEGTDINWVLFIVLLFVFAPAAIIYLVIKTTEKKN